MTTPAASLFDVRLPEPFSGWRSIDALLARWVIHHGGDRDLANLAAACSAAQGQGHSALALDDAARFGAKPLAPEALEQARAAGWVGGPEDDTPFVQEGELRFYLRRLWRAENAVANAVAARIAAPSNAHPMRPLDATDLDALFGAAATPATAAQREAVRRCGGQRLFVLTGGPGTGKTTTVLRMLLGRMLASASADGATPRVAVAAPTGKAAQRLVESLRHGRDLLAAQTGDARIADASSRFALPDATTLHRLLGFHPAANRFRRDADHPIDADIVVVDEASMIDIELLQALLAALPETAALWLVGDADQLSPVGPGTAFQDLVQAFEARPSAPLTRLAHSFRAEAPLVALNAALRSGDADACAEAFAASESLQRVSLTNAAAAAAALSQWAEALQQEAPNSLRDGHESDDAAALLSGLKRRQWLCAVRDGPFGSLQANRHVDRQLRQHAIGPRANDDAWYPGRRVLVTRNDADTGLSNGDVGLCLADADGRLRVWFERDGGAHALSIGALPAVEPGFALTVHKAQGSEYDEVVVVLPPTGARPLLSRELLYTAASRARRRLTLHATDEALRLCLETPVNRAGGLHARLAERLTRA